ncbi:hypothetical protein FACS1894170_08760 [Planctomycetales bacterium]|nr:hypothetical protein FACS1894170_08760 [Planctomycetales bacterium]
MNMNTITLQTPVVQTYRTAQVAGMFDVPAENKLTQVIEYESLPKDDDWQIGVIAGPSGSGKTTIAKTLAADNNTAFSGNSGCHDNGNGAAVIDLFAPLPVQDTIRLLTAVGFSSPPSWLKPYSVLSNGEKFRTDLALALKEAVQAPPQTTVVFDEYTSVVDRTVAAVCSTALCKGIRSGKIPCRFVAVTCHYDVIEYLEPDWILDTATGKLSRRLLRRRKPFELEVRRCGRGLWRMFERHHYLSASLPRSVQCYAAVLNGTAAAFCAVIPQYGQRHWYRISRIVTLPDYQGIGIGSRFMEAVGDIYLQRGSRFSITGTHRSVIEHCRRSNRWRLINVNKLKHGRAMVSFEMVRVKCRV